MSNEQCSSYIMGENTLHYVENTLHHEENTLHHEENTLHHGEKTLHHGENTLHHGENTLHQGENTLHHGENTLHHVFYIIIDVMMMSALLNLKQQPVDRRVAPLGHIILIPRRPVFTLTT